MEDTARPRRRCNSKPRSRGIVRAAKRRKLPEQAREIEQPEEWTTLFETFYRAQGVVALSEWPVFVEALGRPLPLTFRVTTLEDRRPEAERSLARVEPALRALGGRPLSWVNAWQLDMDKLELKRREQVQHDEHAVEVSEWLREASSAGYVTRQEAVSMVSSRQHSPRALVMQQE